MRKLRKWMTFLLTSILLMVGAVSCSSVPPTTGVVPTSASLPTAISITPTQIPQGSAPMIINLEDQSISDGERFSKLKLEECVTDEDHDVDEINWEISGNNELEIVFVSGNMYVTLPSAEWTGSETLRFEACDPNDLCDVKDVVFTVRAENDAPVVNVFGQLIISGETFAGIDLDDVVYDEETGSEELAWNVSGGVDLVVSIDEGVASIELPEADWIGQETIHFEACDPDGECGSRDATFCVTERTDVEVEVTYIGNAGFMITVGDKKILIDALYEGHPIPPEVAELLETAQPPFNDVDLILATHIHHDHFHQDTVISHMENNPGAVFVSSPDVVDMVKRYSGLEDRTISIQIRHRVGEKTQLTVDGIGIEAMFLDHGGGTLNLGYVITVDGRRLFHTGDMDPESVSVSQLQRLGLPDKQIDIAFVAHFMLITESQHAHVLDGIQAKYVIPMHFQFTYPEPDYELMEIYFPDAIVFYESMESWVLTGSSP